MKTIEVTGEMYTNLIELATEMTTQDMRCTQMPHMFQIKTMREVAAYEGCGEEIWVDEEGDFLRSEEEITEFIKQEWFDDPNLIPNSYEVNATTMDESSIELKKLVTRLVSEMDDWDKESYLENHSLNWRRISVTTEERFQNTFFTAKACQEHIDRNRYHYTEPTVYLNKAWRNPEMEIVSEFLCGLVGKSNHK